jgi:uncharacterized protein (TIGR03083 family)
MHADMDNDDTAASLLSRSDQRFVQLARDLDDRQWGAPSLCSEWTNHEVLAHLVVGYSAPISSIAGRMLQRRGDFDATNTMLSRELAATRCPAGLLDDFDQLRRHPRGIARLFPSPLMLGDHVIHELDIVFALGRPSTIPVETLTAVLNTEVRTPTPSSRPAADHEACTYRPPIRRGNTAATPPPGFSCAVVPPNSPPSWPGAATPCLASPAQASTPCAPE